MAPSTVGHQPPLIDLDALSAELWRPHFPPVELVQVAAASIYDAAYIGRSIARRAVDGCATEGPSCFVIVSPGSIKITRSDPARADRAKARALARRAVSVSEHAGVVAVEHAVQVAQVVLDGLDGRWLDGEPEVIPALAEARKRGHIVEWSAKSRANMVRRFSTLDYGPLFQPGLRPAMATLTCPDDWEAVAPTARAFKALVQRFLKRYRRAWGRELVGIWKLEFQRRGAPHLHMLIAPPHGHAHDAKRAGLTWRDWFAETWADCLGVQGETRRAVVAVHRHPDACADYDDGLRMSDPKRVGVYFSKHSTLGDKEYQHVVPEAWREDGPGRFWGVWGLAPAESSAEVTYDQATVLARTLRRWHAAQSGTHRARVWRADVRTGSVRTRTVRRPVRRLRGTFGFLALNDGPATAMIVARVLEQRHGAEPVRRRGVLP